MPVLTSLQHEFVQAVFSMQEDDEQAMLHHIQSPSGLDAQQRMAIYRTAIFSSFCRVLQEVYPVIARLLGESFFTAMARVYAMKYPSTQPDLNEYGQHFAEFVEDFEPVKSLPFLSDVARVEWCWHENFYAANIQPFDFSVLASLDESEHANVTFELPAMARLLQSTYPILRIWEQNQPHVVEPEEVNLDEGEDYLLIWRLGYERRIEKLNRDQWLLLHAVSLNWDFASLLEKLDVTTDISLMLSELIQRSWIAGVKKSI